MENKCCKELTKEEQKEYSGGLVPLLPFLTLLGSCLAGGYCFDKDCAERDNRDAKRK